MTGKMIKRLQKYLPQMILAVLMLIILIVSAVIFRAGNDRQRRIFIFPSAENGRYIIEYRNLAKQPGHGDVRFYVDEILLGSSVERTRMLFAPGTVVRSCFVRDSVLFLNLSQDLIDMGEGVIEIRDGFALLEKNIKKNFPKIKEIDFFVEGKSAFES